MTDAGGYEAGRKPSWLSRLRNRLAVRLFRLVATRSFRERVTETWMTGIRYRAHRRRHALGFADDCNECGAL